MRDIRFAFIQFEHTAGDKYANLSIVRDFVKQAARHDVELIVFRECCITG
jgi:predicted amidohydrolase